MQNKKNNNLEALLRENSQAKTFFGSLPDYVQGGIMLRADSITGEAELHRCAEQVFHEFE